MGKSLGNCVDFRPTVNKTKHGKIGLDGWRADVSLYIKQYVLRGSWWFVLLSSIGSLDVLSEYGIYMHAPTFYM